MSVTVYSWRIEDKRTGRWRKLRWQMSEKHATEWAAMEGVPIEKIEGSEEIRTDVSGRGAIFIPAQSTGAIRSGSAILNRGISGNSGFRAGLELVWQ